MSAATLPVHDPHLHCFEMTSEWRPVDVGGTTMFMQWLTGYRCRCGLTSSVGGYRLTRHPCWFFSARAQIDAARRYIQDRYAGSGRW